MPIRFSPTSQSVLLRAQVEASASGLLWPCGEHLLLALLDDPSVAETLVALDIDARRVAQQTRDYLASPRSPARSGRSDDLPRRIWQWLFPPIPGDVALIQRRAAVQVLVSGRSDITPLDLLAALFRVSEARCASSATLDLTDDPYRRTATSVAHPMTALRQAGVTTVSLLRYLAHGDRPRAPDAPTELGPEALVDVHLLNDEYTTMEFVVAALRDEFGLSPQAASDLALRVHWEGVGVVGTLPYAQAEPARRRIEDRALRAGFPLKVVVVPAVEVEG
jgi:ATP-dependent Clp protease adaptor protein ClpS